jgi:hypothetical protein
MMMMCHEQGLRKHTGVVLSLTHCATDSASGPRKGGSTIAVAPTLTIKVATLERPLSDDVWMWVSRLFDGMTSLQHAQY